MKDGVTVADSPVAGWRGVFEGFAKNADAIGEGLGATIEAALPAEMRAQVGFVLITFLPDLDSPQALRRFRRMENPPVEFTPDQ